MFRAPLLLLMLLAVSVTPMAGFAQEKPKPPLGQFVTVIAPIDDSVSGKVRSVALELAGRAERENRPAVLVLEIEPGPSEFHHVQGLASFLSSVQLNKVRTVAWVHEKVTGNQVVIALACREIVLHPDAQLGDISRGTPLDNVQRQFIKSLVDKRLNAKVNWALAQGMLDRQAEILKVKQQAAGGEASVKIVTPQDLKLIRENNPGATIDVERIKESGDPGIFSGQQARALEVLAVQTAETRGDVAAIYGLPRRAMRESPGTGTTAIARLIRVDDMIEPMLELFIKRQIDRALAEKANLLIFEIDSPGGLLTSAENLAFEIAALEERNVRTVAWIPREAISGAAIIALGCDEIYMHPDAKIGDAAPIEIRPGQAFERAPEKVLSLLRTMLRTLAEKKGRPPGLCEAMADRNLEVFQVVNPRGDPEFKTAAELQAAEEEYGEKKLVPETRKENLLTVNGKRAGELSLAQKPPVESIEALKQRIGLPADIELRAVKRTWVDSLVFGLNTGPATFFLFFFGAVLIYLELYTMTGLCGIGSAICFTLFFWSRWGGTAGWLELSLFLLGLTLIALEVLVVPGFGVFGISGGLLTFVSLIMASETFVSQRPLDNFTSLGQSTGTLVGSLLAVIVVAAVISHYLPELPLLKHIVLKPPGNAQDGPVLDPRATGAASPTELLEANSELVGQQGTAQSTLRPAGKARIDEQLIDVISNGPFINPGTKIEVLRVEGNRVIVSEVST